MRGRRRFKGQAVCVIYQGKFLLIAGSRPGSSLTGEHFPPNLRHYDVENVANDDSRKTTSVDGKTKRKLFERAVFDKFYHLSLLLKFSVENFPSLISQIFFLS